MEIKGYKDLNALNKLLFKIKFSDNLDFNEFQIFAESTIIADIMTRLNKEYQEQNIKLGFLKESEDELVAETNGEIEKIVKKRLRIIETKGIEKLEKSGELENYILNLFAPFKVELEHLEKIKNFAIGLKNKRENYKNM